MIPTSFPLGLMVASVLGVILGILIAHRIERRRLARERAEALEPFLEDIQSDEPEQIGTFVHISVPVNAVLGRLTEPPAVAILRREAAAKSFPHAAE